VKLASRAIVTRRCQIEISEACPNRSLCCDVLLRPSISTREDEVSNSWHADHVAWGHMEAERAFGQAARARLRASIARRLLHRRKESARLIVHDERAVPRRSAATAGVREIPLDAVTGTLEAGRAREFDGEFRPSKRTRKRWVGVWLAEHRPAGLPPIDVVRIGNAYAIRDGHHRVSVARARGAATIDAIVA
jgi:hypothetical protein